MTATTLPPAAPVKTETQNSAPPSEPGAPEPKKPNAPQPVNTQQAAAPQAIATQNAPQQPSAQSPTATPSPIEAARVSALLDVNRLLLHSIVVIQTHSKPTAAVPTNPGDPSKGSQAQPSRPGHLSNPHYTDYMRRLQSNLAYLACIADRPHKPQNPIPAFPAIMETPREREAEVGAEGDDEREKELRQKYDGLKELWPEWKGDPKKNS